MGVVGTTSDEIKISIESHICNETVEEEQTYCFPSDLRECCWTYHLLQPDCREKEERNEGYGDECVLACHDFVHNSVNIRKKGIYLLVKVISLVVNVRRLIIQAFVMFDIIETGIIVHSKEDQRPEGISVKYFP